MGTGVAGGWLAWECVVFVVFVFVTTCAPLVRFPWRGDRGKGGGGSDTSTGGGGDAKRNYVFAGGTGVAGGVSTVAMILSVARGTLGVRSFLGFPSELVYRGSAMWETLYGMLLAFPIVAWLFVPLYLRLSTTSVYEYLELRFGGRCVRRLAAGTFVLRQLLNLAVTVYTPCVALHAVLQVPHWAAAAVAAAAAAVFTVLGGLAAAIRADVIQTVTMVVVSVAFIVQGCWRAGGVSQVLRTNIDGGRMQFFKFTWDMSTRVDTLSATLGQLFMSLSIYGCQQTFVQRYVSLGSVGRARHTLAATAPAVALLFSLSWLVGMALFAVYAGCDPLAAGAIAAPDEVLPHYVQEQFHFLPGMLGLFLAALFNGALSFLISNVNSLATVTWEDFVSAAPAFRGISDAHQLTVIKVIGVIYTLLIAAGSGLVGRVGGVVEGSLLVTAATGGALLGAFVLAAACPLATARSTAAGMLAAHALTAALAVARFTLADTSVAFLPTSTNGCENATLSVSPRPVSLALNHSLQQLEPLLRVHSSSTPLPPPPTDAFSWLVSIYSMSYMWYAVIGTCVCVLVGAVLGAVERDPRPVDELLLHPAAARLARAVPALRRRLQLRDDDASTAKIDTDKSVESAVSQSTPPPPPPPPLAPAKHQDSFTSSTSSRLFDAYCPPAPQHTHLHQDSPQIERTRF